MKRILHTSLALLFFWTLAPCSTAGRPSSETGKSAPEGRIETRDQLLSVINAWMKIHHQPEWTMEELIGRMVEEAYVFSPHDNGIHSPVESFLVSLIKNKPF